ncbi:MAG: 50S ribosomal protein L9 [Christensenellales bacterium]|jgi:large subunit ribosomal protein L9
MKVILLKDVKGTGKAGAVAEVSDGYAQNYLIPRGLAKVATPNAINAAKQAEAAEQRRRQMEAEAAKKLAKELNGKTVTVKAKCGENGRLFGAITSKEIADAATAQLGHAFDKKKIELSGNIKELGTYDVPVRLYAETVTTLKVIIEKE